MIKSRLLLSPNEILCITWKTYTNKNEFNLILVQYLVFIVIIVIRFT